VAPIRQYDRYRIRRPLRVNVRRVQRGNQIAKTAATSNDKPTDSSFVTLDEDGTACSSDYYSRLTGAGAKMLKKEIPFTWTRPTSPN